MDPSAAGPNVTSFSPELSADFAEGISLVLSRWTALQMAVHHEWGGRDSLQKSELLSSEILNWFTKSKGPLYVDDLENLLDDHMLASFNVEIEDCSIEEVAEQMMILHEECLQGKYQFLENLRKCPAGTEVVRKSKKVVIGDDEESSEDEIDDGSSLMVIDEGPQQHQAAEPESFEEKEPESVEVEEGWTVVPSRRNRGKRRI